MRRGEWLAAGREHLCPDGAAEIGPTPPTMALRSGGVPGGTPSA